MPQVSRSNDAGIEQKPGVMEYWSIGKKIEFEALSSLLFPSLHHSITPLFKAWTTANDYDSLGLWES
jgi:hypothetical protein